MSIQTKSSTADFTTGLAILLVAQLLSAYMGAYVEDTYAAYGASWTENLFYSHALSLPMFLPFATSLQTAYARLVDTPTLSFDSTSIHSLFKEKPSLQILQYLSSVPRGILFLAVNALTQFACISGVNLLSAKSSAVTVTIVLNIRKLVSFIFSTILFGHQLTPLMVIGSALVFGSGALYGYESSWRIPQRRRRQQQTRENGNQDARKMK